MAFCTICGLELEPEANFCANCGKAINKTFQAQKQRKITFDGEIHKCPNCGETLNSFVSQCPTCNFELRNTNATNSARELSFKLEQIGNEKIHKNSLLNPLKTIANSIGTNETNEQKVSLIRSFLIPNTKEDIIEFMILASSNIDLKLYGFGNQGILTASQREISDAWLAKFEQAYEKAKIVLTGEDFKNVQNMYDKTHKKLKLEKLKVSISIMLPFVFLVLIAGFCLFMAQFE